MIVCDHNGPAGACTNNAARVVHHGEMYIEADLLTVVSTVACDTQRQHNRPGGEV